MTCQQPEWKCIASLGDENPLESGYFVFVDQTGIYDPELEVWVRQGSNHWERSRVILEPIYFSKNGLACRSEREYRPNDPYPEWWSDKVGDLATFTGDSDLTVIGDLCSDDPIKRAWGFIGLIIYLGVFEFDQYPVIFTEAEYKDYTKQYLKEIKEG